MRFFIMCDTLTRMQKIQYGVDVALNRQDDLDKKAIAGVDRFISAAKKVTVIDIGCGAGGTTTTLAQPGASVVGIDILDYSSHFEELRNTNNLSEQQLRFIQGDIRKASALVDELSPKICLMQRVIHYMPYNDALSVLKHLRKSGVIDLFISVTGLESDIGNNYTDKNKPVQKRFCTLALEDMNRFSITQPVCLYTPEEFTYLLQESGWEIKECWVSAFGNVKAVCG